MRRKHSLCLECRNSPYVFGQKGVWHKPASERTKKKDVPAVILEEVIVGTAKLLYIFTYEKRQPNLTGRVATIFPSDFTIKL